MNKLQKQLFALKDEKYRDFQGSLVPETDKESIIGIRIPVLRKFAKEFEKEKEAEDFLKELPHKYYEENNLHMMLIGRIKEYDRCIEETEKFLPYINNWATCDFPAPKAFEKNKADLLVHIKKWIKSGDTYTVRYGTGMLMRLYLDEDFSSEYLEIVADIRSDEYYVNMMVAWYMATALAKQWSDTIVYLEERRLSPFVHKKTIQKAIESYRITEEQKSYLRTLRK